MLDFEVAPFGLISRIDVFPDTGMMGFAFQKQLTRTSRGLHAPAVMEPFTHTDLTLAVGITNIRRTAKYGVSYHMESPDGRVSPLVQAKPSDWPAWTLEGASAYTAQLALLSEALHNREVTLAPSTERFRAGGRWVGLHPLAIRFALQGEYAFRVLVDGIVAAQFDLTVVYECLPYGEPPV